MYRLKQIFHIAKAEILIQLRGAGFYLIILASNILFYAFISSYANGLYTSFLLSNRLQTNLMLYPSLLFLLLGAAIISRDKTMKTEEVIDSYGWRNYQLFLGRWLGTLILWILLGVQLYGVLIVVHLIQGLSPLILSDYIFHFVAGYIPTVIFTNTLGFVVGALLPSPLLAYPILIAYWFLSIVFIPQAGATGTFNTLIFQRIPESIYNLFNYAMGMNEVMPASESLGYFPYEDLIILNRWFYIFLSGFLFFIGLIFYKREREDEAWKYKPRLLAGFFLFGLIILTSIYVTLSFEPINTFNREIERVQALSNAKEIENEYPLREKEYDILIEISPEKSLLKAESTITLENLSSISQNRVIFSLNHALSINSIQSQNGEDLLWERQGDLVLISLEKDIAPAQELTLKFFYEGRVFQWNRSGEYYLYQNLYPENYISPKSISISDDYCWYPSVEKMVTTVTENLRRQKSIDYSVSRNNAKYQLKIVVPQDLEVATGLPLIDKIKDNDKEVFIFSSASASKAHILAGLYDDINPNTPESVQFYYLPQHAAVKDTIKDLIEERIKFYTWLCEPEIEEVDQVRYPIESLPAGKLVVLTYPLDRDIPGVLFLGESYVRASLGPQKDLNDWRTYSFERALSTAWWNFQNDTQLSLALSQYFMILLYERINGPDFYKGAMEALENPSSSVSGYGIYSYSRQSQSIIMSLDRVRDAEGMDGLRRVFNVYRASDGGYKALANAVRSSLKTPVSNDIASTIETAESFMIWR
jgi:hypothetical protein